MKTKIQKLINYILVKHITLALLLLAIPNAMSMFLPDEDLIVAVDYETNLSEFMIEYDHTNSLSYAKSKIQAIEDFEEMKKHWGIGFSEMFEEERSDKNDDKIKIVERAFGRFIEKSFSRYMRAADEGTVLSRVRHIDNQIRKNSKKVEISEYALRFRQRAFRSIALLETPFFELQATHNFQKGETFFRASRNIASLGLSVNAEYNLKHDSLEASVKKSLLKDHVIEALFDKNIENTVYQLNYSIYF